jgi:hypothetical protein
MTFCKSVLNAGEIKYDLKCSKVIVILDTATLNNAVRLSLCELAEFPAINMSFNKDLNLYSTSHKARSHLRND